MTRVARYVILTVVLIGAVATVGAGGVSAQANATDSVDESVDTDEVTNETEQLLYQFEGGGAVRSVDYRDGSTFVTISATDGYQRFAVAEGGMQETGGFEFTRVSVEAGETRVVELPVSQTPVTVTTTQDGFYYNEVGGLLVLSGSPTEVHLQIVGAGGVLGSILALAGVGGYLKRRHKNSYKELFSEERKDIERNAFEGWRDRLINWVTNRGDNKTSTVIGLALIGYVVAVAFGHVASPGEVWVGFSDAQRLFTVGVISCMVAASPPMYYLADRLYDPDLEFVLDLDAKDVYKAAAGDKSGVVAAYTAPPERIAEMDVDGGVTTIETPGGRGHLVRSFDPEENTAEGNPPHLADDREASIEAMKIETNRKELKDDALVGRRLTGSMSAFRVAADTAAMRDMDAALRDTLSAGQDSMEDVLANAVEGTRYEGTYQPDSALKDEKTPEEVGSRNDNPTPEESKTGSGSDETTNGSGGESQ